MINNIAGLGTVFCGNGLLRDFVEKLYKIALTRSSFVFFQNHEDMNYFVDHGIVASDKVDVLPGSGVDLSWFSYSPVKSSVNKKFRFLLVSRLLWEKGVGEYAEAARIVKKYIHM